VFFKEDRTNKIGKALLRAHTRSPSQSPEVRHPIDPQEELRIDHLATPSSTHPPHYSTQHNATLTTRPLEEYVFFTCDEGVEPIPLPLRGEYSAEAMWRAQRESGVSLPPHVLVVMIDAVSRPQFIRALPKTLGVLLHHDNQSAFDFQRFSIVGAYSPPNRYAFFSGYPFPDPQVYFKFSVFLFAHIFRPPNPHQWLPIVVVVSR
jgi:hypothetical protein